MNALWTLGGAKNANMALFFVLCMFFFPNDHTVKFIISYMSDVANIVVTVMVVAEAVGIARIIATHILSDHNFYIYIYIS